MELDIATPSAETVAATEVNVELTAKGVSRESGATARRFNFQVTKDLDVFNGPTIPAGLEVYAALSAKTEAYADGKTRAHATPLAKLQRFCKNAEITTPEGGVDLTKFVGQEFRLLCTVNLESNIVFVNAALPPGVVETDGQVGM